MKLIIEKMPLEMCDIQMVEVPKGSKILSASGTIQQSSLVGTDGKTGMKFGMVLCVGYNPEEEDTERYKIFIIGLNTLNELPDDVFFIAPVPLINGMTFHIYGERVKEDAQEA